MSDGSNLLSFINPQTYRNEYTVRVHTPDGPVSSLNELEYMEGMILANVYGRDIVLIIEPEDGRVIGQINLQNLRNARTAQNGEDILNGIAYDKEKGRLFVTGKLWSYLYEISLLKDKTRH